MDSPWREEEEEEGEEASEEREIESQWKATASLLGRVASEEVAGPDTVVAAAAVAALAVKASPSGCLRTCLGEGQEGPLRNETSPSAGGPEPRRSLF